MLFRPGSNARQEAHPSKSHLVLFAPGGGGERVHDHGPRISKSTLEVQGYHLSQLDVQLEDGNVQTLFEADPSLVRTVEM